MKQLDRDPYTYADTTHQDNRNKAIVARVSDNRVEEEPIVTKEDKFQRSYVAFFDFSDIHYGAQDFDFARADKAFEIASQFFNGIMGLGGDFFDNANKHSTTNIYRTRLFPDQAMDGAKAWMQKYKKYLKYGLGGNHCATWGSRNDEDHGPSKELADYLDIEYAEHALSYTLNLEIPNGGAANVKKMNVCIKHVVDNPLEAIMYFIDRGIIPDILIGEHTHTGNEGMYIIPLPVYDKNKLLVGYVQHRVYFMTGYSMQNGNSTYPTEKMFKKLNTNVKGIMVSWKINPLYRPGSVEEERFIPNVCPFNVLHQTENQPGLICLQYLRDYGREDISDFKREVDKMTLQETAYKIENYNKTIRQQNADLRQQKYATVESESDEEEYEYGN